MRPDVDKLLGKYATGYDDLLVVSIQCDGAGEDLCERYSIDKWPWMKKGSSPETMEDCNNTPNDFASMDKLVQSLLDSSRPVMV